MGCEAYAKKSGFISGLPGIDVRNGTEDEKLLLSWLNGEHPETQDDEDRHAQVEIIQKFLPLLRAAYENGKVTDIWTREYKSWSTAMKRQMFEEYEKVGPPQVALQQKLREYPLVLCVNEDISASKLMSTGDNATEGWAAHVLFNMAMEQRLDKLSRCVAAGCTHYVYRRRKVDKFCGDKCRVAHHQSNPAFKAERSRQLEENRSYKLRGRERNSR